MGTSAGVRKAWLKRQRKLTRVNGPDKYTSPSPKPAALPKVKGEVFRDGDFVYYAAGGNVYRDKLSSPSVPDAITGYLQGRWESSVEHWNHFAPRMGRPIINYGVKGMKKGIRKGKKNKLWWQRRLKRGWVKSKSAPQPAGPDPKFVTLPREAEDKNLWRKGDVRWANTKKNAIFRKGSKMGAVIPGKAIREGKDYVFQVHPALKAKLLRYLKSKRQ